LSANEFNLLTDPPLGIRVQDVTGSVRIRVLNVVGREMRRLWNGPVPGGSFTLPWDGRDDGGSLVSTSVYVVVLDSGDEWKTLKVLAVKR
jgi:hypothetical protein